MPSNGASVTIQLTGMFPTRQASARPRRGSGSEVTGNESSPGPSPAGHGNAPGEGGIWGRAPASPVLIKTPPTPTGAARELGLQLLAPLPRGPDRLARGISHGGAAPDERNADCRRARILGGTQRLLLCREPSSRSGRSAVTVTRRCRDEARNLEVTGGEGAGEERGAGPGPWGDAAPAADVRHGCRTACVSAREDRLPPRGLGWRSAREKRSPVFLLGRHHTLITWREVTIIFMKTAPFQNVQSADLSVEVVVRTVTWGLPLERPRVKRESGGSRGERMTSEFFRGSRPDERTGRAV